jgi:hypothetical protein
MQSEVVKNTKEAIEHYFHKLAYITKSYPDIASSIFELNSSAYGHYVRKILKPNPQHISPSLRYLLKCFFLGSMRLWGRAVCLWWMKYYIRGARMSTKDKQHSRNAIAIFIGHVAHVNDQFIAKDFTGFIDPYLIQQNTVILGQRLPHIQWRDYLTSTDFIPVEVHSSLIDVLKVWVAHTQFFISLLMSKAETFIIHEYARDFSTGRGPNSTLYARVATTLILSSTQNDPRVYIPLERHDWECLILHRVKQQRQDIHVALVQNCTFSLNDYNMYVLANTPAYRSTMPDCCYVIDEYWQSRLMEMGLATDFKTMYSHRFSNIAESVVFNFAVKKTLYLGSINPEKVRADFQTLLQLPAYWLVDVRLHPSLSMILVPERFRRISNIADEYSWCIHTDTSMVVFLRSDTDRFIYIDHPYILNQNPLPIIGRQGKNVIPEQLLSLMEC